MRRLLKLAGFFAAILIGGAVFGLFFLFWIRSDKGVIKDPIPSPQVYNSPAASVVPSPSLTPSIFPASSQLPVTDYQLLSEVNLAVPFTIQAPHQNWEDPYGEFCEEASVLMAASYIKGWDIPSPEFADKKMLEIKTFEEKRFGYYKDTTAEETALILKEFYEIEKVKVVYDPTVDDIKKALNEKRVIIVPAAGRELGNPNFRRPGPLYHMLVIKGYTKEGNFITNDPGTRKGADYIYSPEVITNAIHDWNNGDVSTGKRGIIIVG